MPDTAVGLVSEDHSAALSQIAAPTLILWGDHVASEDPGTPFGDCKIYTQIIKDAGAQGAVTIPSRSRPVLTSMRSSTRR